jgi:hypothetical protein
MTPLREVRSLGQAAAVADDRAVTRIVTFLDALAERGDLDRILDPVRPRLRGLGTPRRLRMARLLFLPLDGAVVPAADWSRGAARVPRSALRALTDAVEEALGAAGRAISAEADTLTTRDAEAIGRLGGVLWPAAAEALPQRPPSGWDRSGLAAADYAPIAALCRPVWAAGPAIWAALDVAAQGPPDAEARAALAAVLPAGPEALEIALATLLLRAATPGRLIQLAAGLHRQARKVAQRALDTALEAPLPGFAILAPRQAAEAAEGLADWLDDLDACPLLSGDRKRRLVACRQMAEAEFRASYASTAERHMLRPAQRLAAAEVVQDAEVVAMEAAARQVRALDAAGRRLGGPARYDATLRRMTEAIAALAPAAGAATGLRRMDIARTIEILAGPDAGAALMRQPL